MDTTAGRLVDVAGAGAVAGTNWKQGLTELGAEPPGKGEPAVDSSQTASAPVSALAAVVQICTHWRVQYVDTGGEDYLTGWSLMHVPASFSRGYITNSSGAIKWLGNLNLNGCTPGLTLDPGTYTLNQTTADQRWGTIEFDNDYDGASGTVSTWLRTGFTVTSSPSSPITLFPTGLSIDAQTAALTGWLLYRHAALGTGMGLSPTTTVTVHANRLCPGSVGSCTSLDGHTVWISPNDVKPGQPRRYWKFNVMHELGHAVMEQASGTPSWDYNANPDTKQLCTCNGFSGETGHCLQSREESNAAQHEGFVHAFASRAFNNHQQSNGIFVYYKQFRESEGATPSPPPISKSAYDVPVGVGWMESKCTPGQHTGNGVEWDWLTFVFKVTNESLANPTTPSAFFNIYKRACTGNLQNCPVTLNKCTQTENVQWSTLRDAANCEFGQGSARAVRFFNNMQTHGVDH